MATPRRPFGPDAFDARQRRRAPRRSALSSRSRFGPVRPPSGRRASEDAEDLADGEGFDGPGDDTSGPGSADEDRSSADGPGADATGDTSGGSGRPSDRQRRGLRSRLGRRRSSPGPGRPEAKTLTADRAAIRALARVPAVRSGIVGGGVLVVVVVLLVVAASVVRSGPSLPVLQFAQPAELAVGSSLVGEPAPFAGVPEEMMEAYEEAQLRSGVPWGALAAVGHLTTDHGRYSPYDDSCPQRDVFGSVRLASERLTGELTRVEGQLATLSAEAAALEVIESRSAGQDSRLAEVSVQVSAARGRAGELAVSLDTIAVRTSPELLGSSWRPCLIDRDPGREVVLPPGGVALLPPWDFDRETGAELPAPAGVVFDRFWWRWSDVTAPDTPLSGGAVGAGRLAAGPLMLLGGDPGSSRDPENVFDAATILAGRIDAASAELASQDGQRSLGIAAYSGDVEQADPFWSDVFDRLGVLTLLEDPADGCSGQSGPVPYLIEVIWRCELAQFDLLVVTGVSGKSSGDSSEESVLQVASQRDAADLLVAEALRVAAGFSQLGEADCDDDAALAGVFPLTSDTSKGPARCDPEENIASAAKLVGAAASAPLPLRSRRGPFAPMLAGWDALPLVIGDVDTVQRFVVEGPSGGARELSADCSLSLVAAADMALADPQFPDFDASDAELDLWFAGRRFAQSSGCGGVAPNEVERTLRRAFVGFDVHDEYGGDGSVPDDVLAARADRLVSYLADRPTGSQLPQAVWGEDSFVPRLSSELLTWPEHPGRILAEPKPAVPVGELAVPLMIRYSGTFAGDERAGLWTVSLETFNRVAATLPTLSELSELHEAFDVLTAAGGPVTSLALADAASVSVSAAGSYLSARRMVELSGAEATLSAIEVELYRAGGSVVLAGVVLSAPVDGIICPIGGLVSGQPNDWGFPRSNGRRHQGNDVFAPTGTPVVAVRNFTVTSVVRVDTWFPGTRKGLGGLHVSYRDDRGDVWYNAHLHPGSVPGHIERGYSGSAGEVIGHVGVSGNARSTPPHLHIERRVGGGMKTNPYPAIFPACAAQRIR